MSLFGLVPWPRISWIAGLPADFKERLHDAFGLAHTLLGYSLDALLALHVAAALKHQFVDAEPELQRMWPAPKRR